VFGGSGSGPIGFDFADSAGKHHIASVETSDCRRYEIEPGQPLTSAIKKSGAFSENDPDAAFIRSFLQGPTVALPPGDWTISAVASPVEGADCSGASRSLKAAITVQVSAP